MLLFIRTLLFFSNADPISALPGGDWDLTWRAALTSALVPGFAPGILTSAHLQIRAMATLQGAELLDFIVDGGESAKNCAPRSCGNAVLD